jgi:translation initiation factor 2 beta subunit (eIF-2beta)/eIF-5
MILIVLDNQNTKNEITKICNEPGTRVSIEMSLKCYFFKKLSCGAVQCFENVLENNPYAVIVSDW